MLTYEEMLICNRELQKRGYRYIWCGGGARNGYFLIARKHPPFSAEGTRETPAWVQKPEDLARYIAGVSA